MPAKKEIPNRESKKGILINFKSGFTLVEILAVLAILGLVFSTVFLLFWRGVNSSLEIAKRSEELQEKALLYWRLTRAIYGAKRLLLLNGTELYLYTTGGNLYGGVVKEAYIFKNGTLYYYEFPYPYKDIRYYDKDKLMPIFKADRLEFLAEFNGGNFTSYSFNQLPSLVWVKVDGEVWKIIITSQR